MKNSERPTQVSAPPRPAAEIAVRRLRHLLRVLGPAWIVMLADVDAASVVTAAQAGSSFGYAMLLPLLLLIPLLYLVQEMTARLAIVTGLGHAELIRERFGMRWAAVAVGAMVIIDLLAYVAEFAGIVLGASLVGISAGVAVGGALVLHAAMVLTGSYGRFERLTLVLSFGLFAFVALALAGLGQGLLGFFEPAQGGTLWLAVSAVALIVLAKQMARVQDHWPRRATRPGSASDVTPELGAAADAGEAGNGSSPAHLARIGRR